MWETGRARGVLKGSEFRKGRKKCQGWGVFERSLFICKVFSPKWGPGAGWRREKEAGVSLGLYLLQLRWITKLLPWANHSKRLTSSTTEPVIPFEEIGNWFLLEEREIIQQIGALVESHLLSGENCELCCFFNVLLLCFFSPIYQMTTKSIKGVVWRCCLVRQKEWLSTRDARMSGVSEVAQSRPPSCRRRRWWVERISLSDSDPNEPLRCYENSAFSVYPHLKRTALEYLTWTGSPSPQWMLC